MILCVCMHVLCLRVCVSLCPQDLAAINHVPELILAGVSCFKIEGRLKGPEYVAMTTQVCVCVCVCV